MLRGSLSINNCKSACHQGLKSLCIAAATGRSRTLPGRFKANSPGATHKKGIKHCEINDLLKYAGLSNDYLLAVLGNA